MATLVELVAQQKSMHRSFWIILLFAILNITGCGGGTKTETPLVKVSGKVKIGETPMTLGTVEYHPDSSKGNSHKGKLIGMIKSDGSYSMLTDGKEGIPAGWYSVAVNGKGMPDMTKMDPGKVPSPQVFNNKFSNPETSNIKVEVREGAVAGAFDLALTK